MFISFYLLSIDLLWPIICCMIMLRFVPGHEKIEDMAFANHPCADQSEHNLIWSGVNILWDIHTVNVHRYS